MIEIRDAVIEDCEFIGKMIMMALHISAEDNPQLSGYMHNAVADDKTLYYWKRCRVAIDKEGRQERLIGLCLAYDGTDYHERKVYSFTLDHKDGEPVDDRTKELLNQPDESGEGEFYVDSLAVIPEYRGKGIGRILLLDALVIAKQKGLMPTILVAPDNESAMRLYKSVGFRYMETMRVFWEEYDKMGIRY